MPNFVGTRGYRGHIAGLWAIGLLSSPLGLLAPLPLKIAVDSAVGDQPLPGFLQAVLPAMDTESKTVILGLAVVLMLLVTLLSQLQSMGSTLLHAYTGERMVLDFRAKLFRHVQRLSIFPDVIPVGDGVFAFNTLEEAEAAIKEVDQNYQRHSRAAREIAEEYFDSEKILPNFVEQAMCGTGRQAGTHTGSEARAIAATTKGPA